VPMIGPGNDDGALPNLMEAGGGTTSASKRLASASAALRLSAGPGA